MTCIPVSPIVFKEVEVREMEGEMRERVAI
jgi:hypothetical protein